MMDATLFDLPPTARPDPSEVRCDATFTAGDTCRLTLTRTWRAGPHVCFIGLNPSTADHRKNDPTSLRWIHFASAWGYGGYVAVNLYPYRSPSPAECRKWADWTHNGPDWYARDAILHNVDVVAREAKRAALVVACWGAGAWDDLLVEQIMEEIQCGEEPWPDVHCFGKTGAGDPIHPLARGLHRVPDDAKPLIWRASPIRTGEQS